MIQVSEVAAFIKTCRVVLSRLQIAVLSITLNYNVKRMWLLRE